MYKVELPIECATNHTLASPFVLMSHEPYEEGEKCFKKEEKIKVVPLM